MNYIDEENGRFEKSLELEISSRYANFSLFDDNLGVAQETQNSLKRISIGDGEKWDSLRMANSFQRYSEKIVINQLIDLEHYASRVMTGIKKNMMLFLNSLYQKEHQKSKHGETPEQSIYHNLTPTIGGGNEGTEFWETNSNLESLKENFKIRIDKGFEPIKFLYANGTPIKQYEWFSKDKNSEGNDFAGPAKKTGTFSVDNQEISFKKQDSSRPGSYNFAKILSNTKRGVNSNHHPGSTDQRPSTSYSSKPQGDQNHKSSSENNFKQTFDRMLNVNHILNNKDFQNKIFATPKKFRENASSRPKRGFGSHSLSNGFNKVSSDVRVYATPKLDDFSEKIEKFYFDWSHMNHQATHSQPKYMKQKIDRCALRKNRGQPRSMASEDRDSESQAISFDKMKLANWVNENGMGETNSFSKAYNKVFDAQYYKNKQKAQINMQNNIKNFFSIREALKNKDRTDLGN
jgi:hypothetical protein